GFQGPRHLSKRAAMPSSNPLLTLPGMDGFRKRVEATLLSSVAAEDELLAQMGGHLITAGGTRARPRFAVCSAAIVATDAAADEDGLMVQTGGHLITAGGRRARRLFAGCSAAIWASDPGAI